MVSQGVLEINTCLLFRSDLSEPTASRIVRQVEDTLIQSGLFNLPKELPQGDGIDWNVVIVDATEIPIQRPKKTEEKL